MAKAPREMTLSEARALLGVRPQASPTDLRRAFRDAAKAAHPDRAGGSSDRFRRVMAAYRQLEEASAEVIAPRVSVSAAEHGKLVISPLQAWNGGAVEHRMADGRTLRIRLPVGLRNGDLVRAEGEALEVVIEAREGMTVRGDDLWLTVSVPPRVLEEGGRVAVVTPIGRRILWVSKKAGERRLVRAPGLGLPASGRRPQGSLFVRLAPKTGPLDSAARLLLRRFSAVWAV
jgi:curved DNA-binding protein